MPMNPRSSDQSSPDHGLTLIELMVAMALLVIVVVVAGSLLVSSIRTQRDVSAYSDATKRGEVISRSIESGVRNSSSYALEPATTSGQLLRARVAVQSSVTSVVWKCQAWYYDAVGHRVYMKLSNSAIPVVSGAAAVSSWDLLADGITKADDGSPVFGGSANQLQLEYVVTSGDVKLVLVPNTIVRQITVSGGVGPTSCS